MRKKILITGGAGFIGSHLADELIDKGHSVRVLDILSEQVHREQCLSPEYLNSEVELVHGNILNSDSVKRALRGVDAVYHFAAAVGVGQSMYEIKRYVETNNLGTAVLLEALINSPVEALVVASSMSLYGEGLYRTASGKIVQGQERNLDQLRNHDWELRDELGNILEPLPTTELKQPSIASVYALSKYDQEKMCLMIGKAYGIPTYALRFFNVYGTRQSLSNPYTGVMAIFASRLLNGKPPLIYEDGLQLRDFVNVRDIVQACRRCLERPEAAGSTFNVGSGQRYTIRELAGRLAQVLNVPHIDPEITGKYRVGDIRHCFADITQARQILGYEPQVTLEEGLTELVSWLEGQKPEDRFAEAGAELAERGLTV